MCKHPEGFGEGIIHYNVIVLQSLMIFHSYCTMEIESLSSVRDLVARFPIVRLKKLEENLKSSQKVIWKPPLSSTAPLFYVTSSLICVKSLIFFLTLFPSSIFVPSFSFLSLSFYCLLLEAF